MGLEPFQHDILAKESPSHVSTSPDRPLEQNEDNVYESSSQLPPLTQDELPSLVQRYRVHQNTPKNSPQNMPQYRNVFNDRARRDFCYWLVEKKGSKCKGYSFGAYKTSLGLPKV